jgi:hypothetical protein
MAISSQQPQFPRDFAIVLLLLIIAYAAESHALGIVVDRRPSDFLSIKRARCVALEMSFDVDRLVCGEEEEEEETLLGNTQMVNLGLVGPLIHTIAF